MKSPHKMTYRIPNNANYINQTLLNQMKRIVLLLTMAVGLLSFSIPAKAGTTGNLERLVEKRLEQAVVFPEFAAENQLEGAVFVSFSLSEDGKIEVNKLEATNQELGQYVSQKLASIDLGSVRLSDEHVFNYRFTFKRES